MLTGVGKTLVLGMGIMAVNVTTWALFIPAIKDIALASIRVLEQFLFVAFVFVCTLLPAELPILFYAVMHEQASRILASINN